MKKPADIGLTITADYRQFIEELKALVASARISAARAVNNDFILLYWDIGRGIVERQQKHTRRLPRYTRRQRRVLQRRAVVRFMVRGYQPDAR